jgi:hypothetical protein
MPVLTFQSQKSKSGSVPSFAELDARGLQFGSGRRPGFVSPALSVSALPAFEDAHLVRRRSRR